MKTYKAIWDDLYQIVEFTMRQHHLQNSDLLDDTRIQLKDNLFILIFPDYVEYVNSGRRANAKMPPTEAIIDWCRKKGISTDNSTVWRIRQGIAREGIAPRPILDQIFKLAEEDWNNEWSDKLFNEIIQELIEWFKK